MFQKIVKSQGKKQEEEENTENNYKKKKKKNKKQKTSNKMTIHSINIHFNHFKCQ